MIESIDLYTEHLSYGSKMVSMKIRPDNVAIVSIKADQNVDRKLNETTILYAKIAEQLQRFADKEKRIIEQRFSTRNLNMKSWMKTKGKELGFTEIEDDGRVLRAKKKYYPAS